MPAHCTDPIAMVSILDHDMRCWSSLQQANIMYILPVLRIRNNIFRFRIQPMSFKHTWKLF